jgi:hypothetical protein
MTLSCYQQTCYIMLLLEAELRLLSVVCIAILLHAAPRQLANVCLLHPNRPLPNEASFFLGCGTWISGGHASSDIANAIASKFTKADCLAHCLTFPTCNAASYGTDYMCYPKQISEMMTFPANAALESYRVCEPGAINTLFPAAVSAMYRCRLR